MKHPTDAARAFALGVALPVLAALAGCNVLGQYGQATFNVALPARLGDAGGGDGLLGTNGTNATSSAHADPTLSGLTLIR